MTIYVDTSAAAKLLVDEPESSAVAGWLDQRVAAGEVIISNLLLETELRRFAVREELSQVAVTEILDRVDLVEPDRALYHEADILPGNTRCEASTPSIWRPSCDSTWSRGSPTTCG